MIVFGFLFLFLRQPDFMFVMFFFRNEDKDIEEQCPRKVVEFVSNSKFIKVVEFVSKSKFIKVVEFVSKSKFEQLVQLFHRLCDEILVFCRAIAVSLDPLFLYVPVIKEDKKCIELNKVLWIIAIVSRSVTDFIYLVHFVVKSKKRRHFWPFFMLNILVILPIPQVRETFIYFLLP